MTPADANKSVGVLRPSRPFTAWMPGTSPGMTQKGSFKSLTVAQTGTSPAIHTVMQTTGVDDFIPSFMHEFVEIPQSKLRLHRVDGRDKPGHDGEGGASNSP